MKAQKGPAAPASGSFETEMPTFEELAADPGIAALLDFEPAPRKNKRKDGWTPALQKRFVAFLAHSGSPNMAAEALGKNRHGVEKVYKAEGAEEFRAAWDGAVDLFAERDAERRALDHAPMAGVRPPFVDGRRKRAFTFAGDQEGQVLNEYGEPEDEDSYARRAEEAKDSVSGKMQRCRRLFLASIAGHPAKRAAFEILTEYPIDWDKAERCEPQPDEPWRKPNMREPDMILTAENGWLGAEFVHGPDRRAELLADLNLWRVSQGLEPIEGDEQ